MGKRDYDEESVPKVLQGPVSPLRVRRDYDAPADAAMVKPIEAPEVIKDQGGPMQAPAGPIPAKPEQAPGCGCFKAECPECGGQAPFNMEPPMGVPMMIRVLKCAGCGTRIPFARLAKTTTDGVYRVMG